MDKIQGQDRAIALLREKTKSNELNHSFAIDCLKEWKNSNAKLTNLVKQGALIRLKKEFYVFAYPFRKGLLSLPIIANKMFGPSYVSLEWALNYYGLIPEYVSTVTSITTKSKTIYDTPLGRFTYDHLPLSSYSTGVLLVEQPQGEHALIASKEKALADFLRLRRGKIRSQKEMEAILIEDMRIESEDLAKLDLVRLQEIYTSSPHSAIIHLITFLKKVIQ